MGMAIGTTPLATLEGVAKINPQSDGTYTAERADGTVFSCQPNGTWEARVNGTAGQWEKFNLNSTKDIATFNPGPVYKFVFDNNV